MNCKYSIHLILTGAILSIGCQEPVSTRVYSHPTISGALVRSVREGEKIWLELTVPRVGGDEHWQAIIEGNVPEGFQFSTEDNLTRFKWIISPDKISFLGRPGYSFSLKNSKVTHHMTITVRPNYSVVLETVGSAIH